MFLIDCDPQWLKKLFSRPGDTPQHHPSVWYTGRGQPTREATLHLSDYESSSHHCVATMWRQFSQITADPLYSSVRGITEAQLTADGKDQGGNKQNRVCTNTQTHTHTGQQLDWQWQYCDSCYGRRLISPGLSLVWILMEWKLSCQLRNESLSSSYFHLVHSIIPNRFMITMSIAMEWCIKSRDLSSKPHVQ